MVDNNEKWEDIEYSNDETDDEKVSLDDSEANEDGEEYSNEEYEEDYSQYEDDDFKPKSVGSTKGIIFIILVVLIGATVFFGYNMTQNMKNSVSQSENDTQVQSEEQVNPNMSTDQMAENFFNEAGGTEQDMMSVNFNNEGEANVESQAQNGDTAVATVTDAPENAQNENDLFPDDGQQPQNVQNTNNPNQIIISYGSAVRLNPFKPFELALEKRKLEEAKDSEALANIPFEIIEPPVSSVPDEHITSLLNTQISGILYDEVSPSAIVNINGQDQFVKVGDVVSGYKIQSISRDKVQIAYGNNSYVASVGELFQKGSVEDFPQVDNLENKFAGRYKKK